MGIDILDASLAICSLLLCIPASVLICILAYQEIMAERERSKYR